MYFISELKRELSLPVAVLYGTGIILGAGIYVLIVVGASVYKILRHRSA